MGNARGRLRDRGDDVSEELLRLRDGDAVDVSGPFTVTTYEKKRRDRGGTWT
jgi:hypothetical protein